MVDASPAGRRCATVSAVVLAAVVSRGLRSLPLGQGGERRRADASAQRRELHVPPGREVVYRVSDVSAHVAH